jgi:hypothetical protein
MFFVVVFSPGKDTQSGINVFKILGENSFCSSVVKQVAKKFAGCQVGDDSRYDVQGDDAGGINGGPYTLVAHGGLQLWR